MASGGAASPNVALADAASPGATLFFSSDNEMMTAARTNVHRLETTGPFDTAAWVAAHVGSGTAIHSAGGELQIGTGAVANSVAKITSTQVCRQMSGTTQMYISVVRLNNLGIVNNVRRWGLYTDTDGFFFQLSGTVFSVVTRKAGVDTVVPFASWNGPAVSGLTFDPATDLTKMNQFGLFFGGMSCRFHINGRVAHGFGANALTAPLTAVLSLPFRYESINSGGLATDQQILSRGTSFHRVSPVAVTPRYRNVATATTTVIRVGPGTLRRISVNNGAPSGTIAIYDNTAASGTLIGTINIPASVNNPFFLDYDVEVINGITIVTSAALDVTVIYD